MFVKLWRGFDVSFEFINLVMSLPRAGNGTQHSPFGLGEIPVTMDDKIQTFLAGQRFAVVDASRDGEKYGNKVLKAYQDRNFAVVPINPNSEEVEGL